MCGTLFYALSKAKEIFFHICFSVEGKDCLLFGPVGQDCFIFVNFLHLLHGFGLGIDSIFCSALASSSLESLNQLILEADRESLPHVYLARGSYSFYSQIYQSILN
jgi:hypothetical protein